MTQLITRDRHPSLGDPDQPARIAYAVAAAFTGRRLPPVLGS
jgi:hypothetical protein